MGAGVVGMLLLSGVLGDPAFVVKAIPKHGFSEALVTVSHSRWSTQMAFMSHIAYSGGLLPPEVPACEQTLEDLEEAEEFFESFMMRVQKFEVSKMLINAYADGQIEQLLGYWNSGLLVLGILGACL